MLIAVNDFKGEGLAFGSRNALNCVFGAREIYSTGPGVMLLERGGHHNFDGQAGRR